MSIRTVVVDPEPLFAHGVVAALGTRVQPRPQVVAWGVRTAWPGGDGVAIVGVRPHVRADTVVVDAAVRSGTSLIVVGVPATSRAAVAQLHRAGVRHILPRDCSAAQLLQALRGLGAREPRGPRTVDPHAPTRRELEVVTLLGEGLSNREIAAQLFISQHTVRNHLGHVFAKLEVSSRTQAVVRAGELGWLQLPG